MAGIIVDLGTQFLNSGAAANLVTIGATIGLYTNNHNPGIGDILSAYTEATFGGYAQQLLAGNVDEGVSGHIDTIQFGAAIFAATGAGLPQTVYGYFIQYGGALLAAQKFAASVTISAAGQAVVVVPTLTYQDRSIP
jgi:hypothetical protein